VPPVPPVAPVAGGAGRRAGVLARGAVLGRAVPGDDHAAVLAGAVDVQLAVLALDEHEGLAVARVARAVDEHAVAGPDMIST